MGHVKGNLKEFEELMIAIDKNCNGVIDYSEFITAAVNKTKLLSVENLRIAFKMFDVDCNGTITVDELKRIFENNCRKDD